MNNLKDLSQNMELNFNLDLYDGPALDNDIVFDTVIRDRRFLIIRGWYGAPLCYISLTEEEARFVVDEIGECYDLIPLGVHGGVTYCGRRIPEEEVYYLGWDYDHSGDYSTIYKENTYKWHFDEVLCDWLTAELNLRYDGAFKAARERYQDEIAWYEEYEAEK